LAASVRDTDPEIVGVDAAFFCGAFAACCITHTHTHIHTHIQREREEGWGWGFCGEGGL